MTLLFAGRRGVLALLLCGALLAPAAEVTADCRLVEYPDHDEVVCDNDSPQQPGQPQGPAQPRWETTTQREFSFLSPARAGSKVAISADLSPNAIASPGDQLLSYRVDELKDKVYTPSTVTIVYEDLAGEGGFTIREEGSGTRFTGPKVTTVSFNTAVNHPLLIPFSIGCAESPADAVYLKMFRLEGSQLYYRLIIPPCLAKPVERSLTD